LFFSFARAAGPIGPGASRFARIDRRNYDEGLRQRPVIGNAEINPRLKTLRGQRPEPG